MSVCSELLWPVWSRPSKGATWPPRARYVARAGWCGVHAWVGQILLKCNEIKRLFVRPTETLARCHDDAWRGHGRTWLAVTEAPRIHALKRNFSSGGCAFSVESGTEPNKTVPDPVHGSSLAQSRGQGGRPTATHHHGIASALPRLLTATCRARNDMAATQRRYRR